jgi:hypothetical protein
MELETVNLMDALLAKYQFNFGMIYMDPRSLVYSRSKRCVSLASFIT